MSEEAAAVENVDIDRFFESGGEIEQPEVQADAVENEPGEIVDDSQQNEPDKPEKQEKVVPYGALHEERMRRKELQERIEQHEARTKRMEDAFQQLVERSRKDTEPSFDQDPIAALRHQNEQLQQRIAHYDQRFQQNDQQQMAYQQQQKFVSDYQSAAREFQKATPDFTDAYQHLVNTRQSELEALGYSPAESAQWLVQEEAAIVGKAMQDGVNPAQRMYELAKMRGYATKSQEKPAGGPDEERLKRISSGKQASRSLPPGGKSKEEVSLESLAELSGEEFDKAWEKLIGPAR